MAKKPAIIATTAATPPFANREVAGDEVEGVDAAELPVEVPVPVTAGAEPVVVPPVEALTPGVDPEAPEDTGVPDTEPDDTPVALAPAELAGVLNGRELGVAVGPVGVRLAVERERIRSRTLQTTVAKKNRYQQHILPIVKPEQL